MHGGFCPHDEAHPRDENKVFIKHKRPLFWLNRITSNWNSLTQTAVNCTTVRSFKKCVQSMDFIGGGVYIVLVTCTPLILMYVLYVAMK